MSNLQIPRDTVAGLLYVLIGGGTAIGSFSYRLGTTTQPGPGFFPLALGLMLVVLGLIVLIGDLRKQPDLRARIEGLHWRGPVFVVLAVLSFGLLLKTFGVIVAVAALSLLGSFASQESRWRGTVVITAVFCITSVVLFVWGLKVQLPIAPFLIGR